MPCDSSHLEATQLEVEVSRLYVLLREISGGRPVNPKSDDWRGYHKDAYGAVGLRATADLLTSELCKKIASLGGDVSDKSLELQIWWRDHKKADAAKAAREKQEKQDERDRKAALAKLTDREIELLKIRKG